MALIVKRLERRVPHNMYAESKKKAFFKKDIFYKEDFNDKANIKNLKGRRIIDTKIDFSDNYSAVSSEYRGGVRPPSIEREEPGLDFGFVDLCWPDKETDPELKGHYENTRPIHVG